MENTIRVQSEPSLDDDALFLVSLILLDVHQAIKNIQVMVAVLLRYATLGVTVTNSLIQLIAPEED